MKKVAAFVFFATVVIPLSAQEVGIQLYSLRNQFKTDVTGSLDIIQSWGITKLEGGDTYGMSKEDFKKELTSRNMEVVSIGTGFEDLFQERYPLYCEVADIHLPLNQETAEEAVLKIIQCLSCE